MQPGRSASRLDSGAPGNVEMPGDTIVLSTADSEGNMVSWVNSNFYEFGSGITVPGYGFVLHNRGALFTLDPHSPNAIAPAQAALQHPVGGVRACARMARPG